MGWCHARRRAPSMARPRAASPASRAAARAAGVEDGNGRGQPVLFHAAAAGAAVAVVVRACGVAARRRRAHRRRARRIRRGVRGGAAARHGHCRGRVAGAGALGPALARRLCMGARRAGGKEGPSGTRAPAAKDCRRRRRRRRRTHQSYTRTRGRVTRRARTRPRRRTCGGEEWASARGGTARARTRGGWRRAARGSAPAPNPAQAAVVACGDDLARRGHGHALHLGRPGAGGE